MFNKDLLLDLIESKFEINLMAKGKIILGKECSELIKGYKNEIKRVHFFLSNYVDFNKILYKYEDCVIQVNKKSFFVTYWGCEIHFTFLENSSEYQYEKVNYLPNDLLVLQDRYLSVN